jgi:tripartite-type tricarboxylate transporter receptor subunit TctC
MPKLSSLRSGAIAAAVLAVFALAAAPAVAQDYPNRPITLIVPFPPGGSTTIVGRIVADKMSEVLGQSIVVDNRGGAGGTIGSRTVAKAPPTATPSCSDIPARWPSGRAFMAMSATTPAPISSRSAASARPRTPWWCTPRFPCTPCPS